MRILLTGGTGFIGGRLTRALVDAGHDVVCLCRSDSSAARAAEIGAEVVRGDLAAPESLPVALEAAAPTHVAHLAAEIATQRDEDRIRRVNVDGTRALVEACRGRPLERFLFLSTVVRGEAHGETLTEDGPIPTTTAYGRSKAEGERMVFAAHAEWGLPAVVLRPSHVYGPGGWLAALLADRLFRIPGKGDNWWDVVHVDDVVAACVLLLERGEPGEAYHVVDDTPITMNDFFGLVTQALGRRPFGHVPVWLARLIGGKGPVDAAVRSARSSNAKLRALGWRPRWPSAAEGVPPVVEAMT